MNQHTTKPKLLLAEFHHLGDAVLALPFLRGAMAHWDVQVWCRPPVAEIFQWVLPRSAIRIWSPPWHEDSPPQSWPLHLRDTAEIVQWWKAEKFSAAVSVWADPRLHFLFTLAGIPQRVGLPPSPTNFYGAEVPHRAKKLRQASRTTRLFELFFRRPLLTHPVHRTPPKLHQLDLWQQLAQQLGHTRETPSPCLSPDLNLPLPPALARAIHQGHQTLLIHPGGRLPSKRWPLDYHHLLLEKFLGKAPNWQAFLVAGPEDNLSSWSGPGEVLPTPPNLAHLLRWLAAGDFILANDSLPAHLAAALGRPCLAIFGSGDPWWFAPGGDQSQAVSTPICPFRPCLDQCRQPAHFCLESLGPDLVLERLLEKISL